MSDLVTRPADPVSVESEHTPTLPETGSWWWVEESDTKRWLGCVIHVGSNYAQLVGVTERKYYSPPSIRVHLDEFDTICKPELDANARIAGRIEYHRQLANKLMEEVKTITGRLGIAIGSLPEATAVSESTQAIALRPSSDTMKHYRESLEKAKDKTLPALFKRIQEENEAMANWMTAQLLPLKSQAAQLTPAIAKIERQIFNVELYAGLVEQIEQIADGDPASLSEPVHLFQRRAYMDEECLARYRAGGMSFGNIEEFDKWIAAPENRDRLLPFNRCVLAFRVRRNLKEIDTSSLRRFIELWHERDLDKMTFLYMRNGDQLFRLRTKIEFGANLFPDLSYIESDERLFGEFHAEECKRLVGESTVHRREDAKAKQASYYGLSFEERCKLPYVPHVSAFEHYKPYEPASVFYDDMQKFVEAEMARHNRLVLVLQGVLDRSPVFHPHPPWHLWTPEGFATGLCLIYDSSRTLTTGEAPDFETYRRKLNSALKADCITVGQEDYWERVEAEKESRRRANHCRVKGDYRPKRFRPYGDPGPGTLARVENYRKGVQTCTYIWEKRREREAQWRHRRQAREAISKKLTVPVAEILNVSAYTAGDFMIFFDDPRTREDYLKWAPLLLEAEEYKAGNRHVGVPAE